MSAESEVDITGVVAAEEDDDEVDAKTTDGWQVASVPRRKSCFCVR